MFRSIYVDKISSVKINKATKQELFASYFFVFKTATSACCFHWMVDKFFLTRQREKLSRAESVLPLPIERLHVLERSDQTLH
jgi:hypothetical protein